MWLKSTNRSLLYYPSLLLLLVALLAASSWWFSTARSSTPALQFEEVSPNILVRTGASTDALVEGLQTKLRSDPDNWQALSQLGSAYLQKARETGDPTYYQKAETALQKALALEPEDYGSISAMGALELARHRFQAALEWGERALLINPNRTVAYGVVADAQIELGLYEDARQTLQKMVDLRPDMSSYSRISYLRELHGDTDGAIEIMQWAVDSGSPAAENTAWTRTQLGNLYLSIGDLSRAEAEYRRTLADMPGYVYALAGLGRVRAAQGRTGEAVSLLAEASQVMPLPEFIITLAELYQATGQPGAAQEQVELLKVIQKLYQANGVNLDLELALFNADHGLDLEATASQTRLEYQRRPSIYAADVLAWVLYKNGNFQEARSFSEQALRLGSKDALKLYHAGMIYYSLGALDQARETLERALSINPHFSILHIQEARQTLEELKSGSAGDGMHLEEER